MKYEQMKHSLQAKTVQNSSKQKFWWILMWEDFFIGGSIIMDSYISRKQRFKVKKLLFLTNMIFF